MEENKNDPISVAMTFALAGYMLGAQLAITLHDEGVISDAIFQKLRENGEILGIKIRDQLELEDLVIDIPGM